MVATQLFLNVGVFLIEAEFLIVSIFGLLVKSSLDLLVEGCQFGCLLGLQGIDGCFDLKVSGIEPSLLLCLFEEG